MKIANHSKGFSILGMVVMLLILGSLLLIGLNEAITSWRKSFIYQIHYYRQYNNAYSSISWAKTEIWTLPNNTWQCKSHSLYELNVCIKQSLLTTQNFVLVKAWSKQVKIYHLATYQPTGKLKLQKGHWLDYCPESINSDCD